MKKIFSARNLFILLAAACIVVIFMFSTENSGESSERSGGLAYIAVRLLHRNYDSLPKCEQKTLLGSADHIVRKLAHFSIYAFLGACISFAAGRRKLISRGTFIALLLSSAYACTDELHQHFVPGRACSLKDICLDTAGAVTGILAAFIMIGIADRLFRPDKVDS